MAIILKNAPKTEEGRKLNLTKEQEEQYRIVFRFDKDTKKLANIEPWSSEGIYDNHCVIASLSSTYSNIVKFPNQYGFRNVVGSSVDPNPYGGSWLGVIRLVYDVLQIPCRTDICCLDPYHYDAAGNQTPVPNHGNSNIIGGHMVEWNMDPVYGDLQYFLLLPICQAHNNPSQNPYYFKTNGAIVAVLMKSSLYDPAVRKALLSLADSVEGDGDIEFDVKKYCEENNVEVKDMYFD
jgi:hypothetical protein